MTTRDGEVASAKRKLIGEEERICFLFNSRYSEKVAALYELKLSRDGGGNIIPPYQKGNILKRVATFFEGEKKTHYASCAPLDSSTGLYLLMPNEFQEIRPPSMCYSEDTSNDPREFPCIFNYLTKKTETMRSLPVGLKVNPIAVTLNNKVYVLARRNWTHLILPKPTFEAYDPVKSSWQTLPAPPYSNNIPSASPGGTLGWYTMGYAAYGGDFIIVCFRNMKRPCEPAIYSYSTLSREWKAVHYDTPVPVYDDGSPIVDNDVWDDEDDKADAAAEYNANYLVWDGEGLVINNFIYAYVEILGTLVSYNCTKTSKGGSDFSLDKNVVLYHLVPPDSIDTMVSYETRSGAVGKIRDDLICLVKTFLSVSEVGYNCQPVYVTIFSILEGGRCCKLQSFGLSMPADDSFRFATISSCFMLQPEVVSNMEHGDRTPKKRSADAGLGSEVQMMETTVA